MESRPLIKLEWLNTFFKKDNTFVYMYGFKGMVKGIDDIMSSLAAGDGEAMSSLYFVTHTLKKLHLFLIHKIC